MGGGGGGGGVGGGGGGGVVLVGPPIAGIPFVNLPSSPLPNQ